MFALDEFKIVLADAFLTAYNTIIGFESKIYHSLYIQLFANDKVVNEVCKRYKNVFYVTKIIFNY